MLAFFRDLGASDVDAARSRVAPGFQWFGRRVPEGAWSGAELRSFLEEGLEADAARAVPEPLVIEMAKAAEVLGGELEPGATLVLADIRRSGAVATAAALVSLEGKIIRIFDPERAREYLLALSSKLASQP